jgi:hypothetical protein
MSQENLPSRTHRARLRADIRLLSFQIWSTSPLDINRGRLQLKLETLHDELFDVEQLLHRHKRGRASGPDIDIDTP